jgi:hypothetical protein
MKVVQQRKMKIVQEHAISEKAAQTKKIWITPKLSVEKFTHAEFINSFGVDGAFFTSSII